MRVTWVNPAFADYRVPVYAALSELLAGQFTILFSRPRVSPTVFAKIQAALGEGAVGLTGERNLWSTAKVEGFANRGINIPWQPGLLTAIAKSEPDVIVSEGFFQWTPASLLFRIARRVPLVIAYERTAHTERNAGALRFRYRRLISRVTDAIACNGSLSRQYCMDGLGIPADRILTGAMAADSEFLAHQCGQRLSERRAAAATAGAARGPVFLYVGQLIPRKGLRELLRGWSLFCRNEQTAGSLVLVGDGPERASLENMVRELHLRDVTFAGPSAYEAIAAHYAAADALVMPTLEDNWSLVVPEAMACGLPILCSRHNGCWPELVKGNVNGWVFDPTDAGAVAQVFLAACRDRERLSGMGQSSREIVQAYSPREAARAVLRACQVAVARPRGRHRDGCN